ncbi:ATP-dependent DNA helicase PIF1-like protein, partial [Tanacetum coccineum]
IPPPTTKVPDPSVDVVVIDAFEVICVLPCSTLDPCLGRLKLPIYNNLLEHHGHGSDTLIPDVRRIPSFVIMLVGAAVAGQGSVTYVQTILGRAGYDPEYEVSMAKNKRWIISNLHSSFRDVEISWSPYCGDDEESRYNHDDAHSSHLLIDGSFNQLKFQDVSSCLNFFPKLSKLRNAALWNEDTRGEDTILGTTLWSNHKRGNRSSILCQMKPSAGKEFQEEKRKYKQMQMKTSRSQKNAFDVSFIKAILAPTNEVVDNMNEHLLEKVLGEEMVNFSRDSVDETKHNAVIDQSIFSPEFINGLKLSGVPNVTPRQGGNARRDEKGNHHNTLASI